MEEGPAFVIEELSAGNQSIVNSSANHSQASQNQHGKSLILNTFCLVSDFICHRTKSIKY